MHGRAKEAVGLVFVFLAALGALLSPELDASLEEATDEGFGGVPCAVLCKREVRSTTMNVTERWGCLPFAM
jgi:hypothetical protein